MNTRSAVGRILLCFLAASLVPACGGSSGGSISETVAPPPPPPGARPSIFLWNGLVGAQNGNVSIKYDLIDPESDTLSLKVEFSPNGGASFFPATAGPGGDGVSGLPSSQNGVTHFYSWDSKADDVGTAGFAGSVVLRLTASDAAPGPSAATLPFSVSNSGKYLLQLAKSTAVPTGAARGIATDQTHFWVISGGENFVTSNGTPVIINTTLAYFDPDTLTVLRSFTYSTELTDRPGTFVSGITWDGSAVWIAVSGSANQLVQVDANTGAILKSFSSPSDGGAVDLDWDGTSLWLNNEFGQLYVINPINGGNAVFLNLQTTPMQLDIRRAGIAVRGNEVWTGDVFANDIFIYDKTNGSLVGVLPGASVDLPAGMCFFGPQLVVLGRNGSLRFYDIIPN